MADLANSRGDRSVYIGGNATNNIIQTGDGNTASLKQVQLPSPESVDIVTELKGLRSELEAVGSPDKLKIDNAVAEAQMESDKDKPDKDEVGKAIARAMEYATKADDFANVIEKLKKHLVPVVAWLGTNWYHLLPVVGLVA